MSSTYSLLLIEDDEGIATSLQAGLEREGYTVYWAATGTHGLDLLHRHQPHLILLDVRLPDGSGFDVCRTIRAHHHKQPIIMLTVQRDETDKVLGLELGADDYVTKPFSLRELLSRVRAQLRRGYGDLAATNGAALLQIGAVTIDPLQGQAYRDDVPLNLTPTELRLLVFLAQHPNRVLSRRQILEAVWGYAVEVESDEVVKVNVRRLREKIELDPSNPTLLLTVPGVGYRLVVS